MVPVLEATDALPLGQWPSTDSFTRCFLGKGFFGVLETQLHLRNFFVCGNICNPQITFGGQCDHGQCFRCHSALPSPLLGWVPDLCNG